MSGGAAAQRRRSQLETQITDRGEGMWLVMSLIRLMRGKAEVSLFNLVTGGTQTLAEIQ